MGTKRISAIPPAYRKSVEKKLRDLSKAIQCRREEMGLTQEELAEKLDISVISLQYIEQNRRFPSLPRLVFICEYLKLPISFE